MRHALFAALLALPMFACGAADDAASSAQDVVFHPGGPGGDVTLTLNVPKGAWPARFFYGSTAIQPNVANHLPYQPGPDGRTMISIEVAVEDNTVLFAQSTFAIAMGENTIALGELQLDHADSGWGPTITLDPLPNTGVLSYTNDAGKTSNVWTLTDGSKPPTSVYAGDPHVPTFLGHYAFTTSTRVSQFDVAESAVATGQMYEPSISSTVRILPDSTLATFPNSIGEQPIDVSCVHDGVAAQTATLDASSTVYVLSTTIAHCTWGFGKARVAFDLAPNGSYRGTLMHLDIDDVDLTDSPGQKASGIYVVTLPDGTPLTDQHPTKTSIDLPPGTYTVTTTYSGADGFSHTTTGSVTL